MVGTYIGAATRKTIWNFLKIFKKNYHMIQKSKFWVYIQRKLEQYIKNIIYTPVFIAHLTIIHNSQDTKMT